MLSGEDSVGHYAKMYNKPLWEKKEKKKKIKKHSELLNIKYKFSGTTQLHHDSACF